MTSNQIGGLARAILPAILAYAVGRGWIPESAVADISAVVLAIGAAVWSWSTNKA